MNWRLLIAITVICWGVYNVILKAVSDRIIWQLSLLWYIVGYTAMVGMFCAINLTVIKPNIWQVELVWPLVSGILCGLGSIAFFKAIPVVPGSILMPLTGLFVLVSALGCLFFLQETVTPRGLIGIGCAVAAMMLLGR